MGEMAKCEKCGSTLAVNGKCPDCGTPPEEPEWLDEHGYQKEGQPAATGNMPVSARTRGTDDAERCHVLPFPEPDPALSTPAELYAAGADHHHPLSPERIAELEEILGSVSKKLNPDGPPPRRLIDILRSTNPDGANHEEGD
jgi:hypothetical protein